MATSSVQIVPVTSRSQQKQFMQLAWDLHKQDPNWIPPLRQNQKELLNFARHPFYDNAKIQTFMALRDGKVVGRIAAVVDGAHNDYHKEKRGFCGFFESINDTTVSRALFDAAKAWLKKEGMTAMRGPCNPSMNNECGLLIEGFDSPPTFMMTYNPAYYEKLFDDYGFKKAHDLYAFWGHVSMLETLDKKLDFVIQEATRRFNIKVRPIDKKNYQRDIETFLKIYNAALPGTWGFVPLSEGELKHMAKGFKHLIAPEMTTFAEVDGKPVGCVFGLLDYNPRIKEIDGKLFPFGFLKLLWNKKAIKKIRLISTNVVPEFQKWGVGLVLLNRLAPEVVKWGVEEAEFSWVLESNKLSRGTLERGGAKKTKTYRIYDIDI